MVRDLSPADYNPGRITKSDNEFAKKINFKDVNIRVKHVDLLIIGKGEKEYYVLIKDFNTLMYDYVLHRGRKHFCR